MRLFFLAPTVDMQWMEWKVFILILSMIFSMIYISSVNPRTDEVYHKQPQSRNVSDLTLLVSGSVRLRLCIIRIDLCCS